MIRPLLRRLRSAFRSWTAPTLPLSGFPPGSFPAPLLDQLDDAQLAEINRLLPWNAFTADRSGRRFGNSAWTGKRAAPQEIPDRRIVLMNERFKLQDKDVLEIGCFEGIHTVALASLARSVTAVDARPENVVKTQVRCAFYGAKARVFPVDVERRPLPLDLLRTDFVHHVGVLYHLEDPVRHLLDIGQIAKLGLWLDTHVAAEMDATRAYEVDGVPYRYRDFVESGLKDPFSGTSPTSKWLRLDDLELAIRRAGFGKVELIEKRDERNGPRVLIAATKA